MSKDNIIPTEIIPQEAIIEIKIKADYMLRLQTLMNEFFPFKDENHRMQVYKDIKENTNQSDIYVYNFTTIIALYAMLEAEAKAQKLTKIVNLNKENGEIMPEENLPGPQA